jgi:hypothetical protein
MMAVFKLISTFDFGPRAYARPDKGVGPRNTTVYINRVTLAELFLLYKQTLRHI